MSFRALLGQVAQYSIVPNQTITANDVAAHPLTVKTLNGESLKVCLGTSVSG